jgi:hypothetical protein
MSGTKAGRRGRGRVRVRVRGKEGHAGKQAGLGRVRLLQHRRGVRRVRCVPCPALPCPLQALPRKGPRSGRVRHAVRPCPSRGQAVSVTRSGLVRHAVRPCPSRGQALSVTRSGRVRPPCPLQALPCPLLPGQREIHGGVSCSRQPCHGHLHEARWACPACSETTRRNPTGPARRTRDSVRAHHLWQRALPAVRRRAYRP